MGLENPFDPVAAIDAQARLMSDLLRRFGSVPLALAAYNAGPGAVESYGGIPPFPRRGPTWRRSWGCSAAAATCPWPRASRCAWWSDGCLPVATEARTEVE